MCVEVPNHVAEATNTARHAAKRTPKKASSMIGTLLLLLPATALGAAVASENEPCIGCITPQSQQQHGSCHAVVYSEPAGNCNIRAMVEHAALRL